MRQRLAKRETFPLIVELEPLFQCNLACSGCGKIQHPEHVLRRRMPVEQAVGAIEESGAPMVSIAGGEPLIHPEIHVIAGELVQARRKFVYLCTNALLLGAQARELQAQPVLRLGGPHGRSARAPRRLGRARGGLREGGRAIRAAKAAGFRVTTNTTFFTHDSPKTVREVLDFLNDDLEVDEMMISPGIRLRESPRPGALPRRRADPRAVQRGVRRRPPQEVAAEPQPAVPRLPGGQGRIRLHRLGDPELFAVRLAAPVLPDGRRLHRDLQGAASRRPTGASTAAGKDPRCDNCMAHCGYEPTAVLQTTHSLRQSLRALVG